MAHAPTSRSLLSRTSSCASMVAGAWLLSAASSLAGTVKVPDLANGVATLQDGLDAALTGDTIQIAAGTYRGSFRVTGKANLRIRGVSAGKVILDARDGTAGAVGPGLVLEDCDGARVESIVIQHALATVTDKGVGILVKQSNGVSLTGVSVFGSEEEGLDLDGLNASLTNCTFNGNVGGVRIMGDGASLSKVSVRNDSIRGIAIFGTSCSATECEVSAIRGGGGLSITGDSPTVLRCKVSAVVDSGFNGITTTGAGPSIADNEIRGCATGLFIVYGAFGQVKKNLIEDCYENGFRTGDVAHHLTIKDNVVRRCGSPSLAGYHVEGIGETLKNNLAEDCAGDGFLIVGADAVLTDNEARRCVKDGFDIHADATHPTLTHNTAKENRGEGFENSAQNAVLVDNSAKKNRIDFANDGTVMTASGNDFAVIGAPTPEID